MAYIIPNSDIWILKGINLEPSYTHSLYNTTLNGDDANKSASRNLQFQTFCSVASGHLKYHLTNYSYLRKNRNSIRLKKKIQDLYDCNYLVFKNTSYENRYFYAFITDLDYVNDNTTEISYQIDVLQTWWFDVTYNECFVERNHTATDVRGENTIPEPVSCNDYVIQSQDVALASIRSYDSELQQWVWSEVQEIFDNWSIMVAVTCEVTPNASGIITSLLPADGSMYGGTYQGIKLIRFDLNRQNWVDAITGIKNILFQTSVFRNTNAVVNIFMYPTKLDCVQSLLYPSTA